MRRIYLPVIVLFAIIIVAFGPQTVNRVQYLDILHIENRSLETILDSIIEHDTHCDYYSQNLMYSISIRSIKDTIDEYYIGAFGSELFDLEYNYNGCFEHKGHWFIVEWDKQRNTVFSNTNQNKEFKLYQPDEIDKDGNMVLWVIDDDSFSFWIYHCVHGSFFLKQKYEIKTMNEI